MKSEDATLTQKDRISLYRRIFMRRSNPYVQKQLFNSANDKHREPYTKNISRTPKTVNNPTEGYVKNKFFLF